ncbi:hypothetical protein CYMTET_9968 [Cymbomonas tetramitiformis]|uniref:Uncharacterized protein n=1 Tax=Cymbomonas tetramitiformis TaxID=36881 RepID=A0AAE0LEH6_9CHLO|nr:hypothetical protein CYMTET_9968 [Cymbomonas tetramitiformis]
MFVERVTLASRLRAARPHGGASPGSPASSSPSDSRSGDPVVPMATLLARPTPVSGGYASTSRTLATRTATVSGSAFVPPKIDETLEPAPQLAVVRTLANKHRRLHPAYSDRDLVEDVYAILRSSASASPYITPLAVLRELGTAHGHTFASLTLRLGKIFRDESHLARLSAPASGGATRGGGGGRSSVRGVDLQHGEAQTFAPGRRAPAKAPAAPANPPPLSEWPPSALPRAHALRELEPPLQEEDAPAAAAAMHLVRLSSEQPLGGDVRLSTGWTPGFAGLSHAGDGGCDPPISTLAIRQHMDDDEEDWPAIFGNRQCTPRRRLLETIEEFCAPADTTASSNGSTTTF